MELYSLFKSITLKTENFEELPQLEQDAWVAVSNMFEAETPDRYEVLQEALSLPDFVKLSNKKQKSVIEILKSDETKKAGRPKKV